MTAPEAVRSLARALSDALAGGDLTCLLCDRGVARATAPVWGLAVGDGFVGPARTVAAPGADLAAVRAAAAELGAGEVLVVAADGAELALWGDTLTAVALRRGACGVVLDGYARDLRALRGAGLGLRARGTVPRRGEATGRGGAGGDVRLAGARVAPGDIVVADTDGVVIVPAERAGEVAANLAAWVREERAPDEGVDHG